MESVKELSLVEFYRLSTTLNQLIDLKVKNKFQAKSIKEEINNLLNDENIQGVTNAIETYIRLVSQNKKEAQRLKKQVWRRISGEKIAKPFYKGLSAVLDNLDLSEHDKKAVLIMTGKAKKKYGDTAAFYYAVANAMKIVQKKNPDKCAAEKEYIAKYFTCNTLIYISLEECVKDKNTTLKDLVDAFNYYHYRRRQF